MVDQYFSRWLFKKWDCWKISWSKNRSSSSQKWIKQLCPLLEEFCPLFKHIAQFRSCQDCISFCPSSGHEKGCSRVGIVGLGVFYVCTYPRMGCVTAEQRTGVGGGILGKRRPHLGKMRPIWAICTKSGQKCSRIGAKWFNHQ